MANGQRLLSLDILRGITVAGMILVNNGWGESFEQCEVDEFEDSDTYYDDDGDLFEERLHWKVYISFWQSKNFRIMTEEELKG